MSEHGYGPYSKGCRCDVCRQAKAEYMRQRRTDARAKARKYTATPTGKKGSRHNAFMPGATRYLAPISRHGTRFAYDEAGCRCEACTHARTSSDAKYRRASTP